MTAYSSVLYSVHICITHELCLAGIPWIAFSGLSYIPRAQLYSASKTTQGKMFPHGIFVCSHVTITNLGSLMSGIVTAVTCLAATEPATGRCDMLDAGPKNGQLVLGVVTCTCSCMRDVPCPAYTGVNELCGRRRHYHCRHHNLSTRELD